MDETFRSGHWLRSTRSTRHPRSIVLLSVTYEDDTTDLPAGYARSVPRGLNWSVLSPRQRASTDWLPLGTKTLDRILPALLEWVRGQELWVISRAGVRDWIALGGMAETDAGDWTTDYAVMHAPPGIIRGDYQGTRVTWLDARNFPWGQLGGELPGHKWCEHAADLCGRWLALLGTHHAGSFRFTTAAQAMQSWRHNRTGPAVWAHGNTQALALERAAMFGGRQETWWYGPVPDRLYHLDCNSLYGSVMMTTDLPRVIDWVGVPPDLGSFRSRLETTVGVADVLMDCTEPIYPHRTRDGVIYPVGQYRTHLCGEELSHAMESRHVRDIYGAATYRPAKLLADWAARWLDARKSYIDAGKPAEAAWCKSIVNSGWAKFAQRGGRWESVDDSAPLEGVSEWGRIVDRTYEMTSYRDLRAGVERYITGVEPADSCPLIAACIAAAARRNMDYLRAVAGQEHVYLQYVDSLLVDQAGLDSLRDAGMIGDLPGHLRLAEPGPQPATIWSATCWDYGERQVRCGVPLGAKPIGPDTWQACYSLLACPELDGGAEVGAFTWTGEVRVQKPTPANSTGAIGRLRPPVVGVGEDIERGWTSD